MAYVTDFQFQNMARIGNDSCCQDQNSIQNTLACNYTLQNFFSSDCEMNRAKQLATSQPGINYCGYGINGCNVDANSQLTIGSVQTHPKCPIDLFPRPFATVPYLGRGSVDPIVESQMMQSEHTPSRKSVVQTTERNMIDRRNVPLIPEMQQILAHRAAAIDQAANHAWMRGGESVRWNGRDSVSVPLNPQTGNF